MFSHETSIRVRYAETDQMGVVYHANFFQYFEVSRVEAIRSVGLSYAQIEQMGIIMPIVEVQARFLAPALYDDLLFVKTTLGELPAQSRIEFLQEVRNDKGQLLVTGKVVLYFLDRASKQRVPMPGELRERLQRYFE
ncbi:MAG TPA: thioesterase family protein [Chitinophagaceae bacterium]|jgi:acyl-CoA thioester hydrolase